MGATCEDCKRDMTKAKGCLHSQIKFEGGKWLDRSQEHWNDEGRCGDCAAKVGEFHHYGCDVERCPKCGEQLITCGCITDKTMIRFKKTKMNH